MSMSVVHALGQVCLLLTSKRKTPFVRSLAQWEQMLWEKSSPIVTKNDPKGSAYVDAFAPF